MTEPEVDVFIGVPKESRRHEHRVGLTPDATARLTAKGHTVVVEQGAGLGARFPDRQYEQAGAKIVYSAEEAYKRADVVCKVGPLSVDDLPLLREGTTILSFHHLAVAPTELMQGLMDRRVTAIAYELIEDADGERPVLVPFSEMAGQMAVHLGAYYLQNDAGGRGILLGDIPGVTPPTVVVLGAGTAGRTAARHALAAGAHVVVVDTDLGKLRRLSENCRGQVATAHAGLEPLEKYTTVADLLIGAVLIPGAVAPIVVTEEMVRSMRPGSVIIDLSIDQGGCVETSRPTTPDRPTFVVHDVVHYCVPNMTANVARTASKMLARAVLPVLSEISDVGVAQAVGRDAAVASGTVLYDGKVVKPQIASAHGLEAAPLILDGEAR